MRRSKADRVDGVTVEVPNPKEVMGFLAFLSRITGPACRPADGLKRQTADPLGPSVACVQRAGFFVTGLVGAAFRAGAFLAASFRPAARLPAIRSRSALSLMNPAASAWL